MDSLELGRAFLKELSRKCGDRIARSEYSRAKASFKRKSPKWQELSDYDDDDDSSSSESE
jgi:hypothetical protein